jgi:lysophospholipase L1-like esterase
VTKRWKAMLVRAALLAAGTAVALLAGEAVLRVAGFEYQPLPKLQFGWPDPATMANLYVPDPDLLWVPRDYSRVVGSARRNRPAIAFLGDSCTEFGGYPKWTLEILSSRRPELATGVKMGVGGWTTEQGLAQLRRDVLPWRPRVVTIYFGWNDHWIALGPPDAEIHRARLLRRLSKHSRLAQLLVKAWMAFSSRGDEHPNRVDLPRYVANLESMVRLAREAGIQPILITAPSGHRPGFEPRYLAERHLRKLSDLVPLHQSYVEATRRVARQSGATLCDVAWAFRLLPPPAERYFLEDGIHLSPEGNREAARILAGCIESASLPAPETR